MKPFAMLFAAVLLALFFATTSVHASNNHDEDLAFFALLLQHQAQQKKKEEKAANRAAFLALADAVLSYARPSPSRSASTYRPRPTSSSRPKSTSTYRPRPSSSSKPKTTTTSKRPTTSSTKRPTTKTQAPKKPAVQKRPTTTKKPTTTSKKPVTKKPTTTTKKPTTPKKPTEKKPVTKKPTTEKKPTTTTPKKPTSEKKPVTPKPVEKKPVTPKPITTTPSKPIKNSAAAQADKIIGYEGRFDKSGNLKVYNLPKGDGGGKYEVAGINDRYHPKAAAELKGMIERGEYQKARDAAAKYLASYTDPSASKSKIPAISFYLRDSSFNRGPGGANTILKHALGLGKGASSADTTAALRKAEQNPQQLLHKLRDSREWYERNYAKRNESSPFWKGLVNRWNKAEQDAKSFGFTPSE